MGVTRKSWEDFRQTGLLWWINRSLHLFGWVIVIDLKDDNTSEVYPARCSYRGFPEASEDSGFQRLTKYLEKISPELSAEINSDPTEKTTAIVVHGDKK